jgi:hypothetical protein
VHIVQVLLLESDNFMDKTMNMKYSTLSCAAGLLAWSYTEDMVRMRVGTADLTAPCTATQSAQCKTLKLQNKF